MMTNATEALSFLLVGVFWGCTNPFMRKGYVETKKTVPSTTITTSKTFHRVDSQTTANDMLRSTLKQWTNLARMKIWLPYAINQLGSLLFYKTLASSNLTLSVPVCNATAMVFSCITSALLGEEVDQPRRAVMGVILVLLGVAICMQSSANSFAMT